MFLASSGFFLNFFWEMAQSPLYRDITERSYGEILVSRLHCTLGDVMILLAAHGIVAWMRRDRQWAMGLRLRDLAVFTGLGLGYTVVSEWVNVDLRSAWSYAPAMPRVPLLGTGLGPFVQWLVLPPVIAAVTATLLRGRGVTSSSSAPR